MALLYGPEWRLEEFRAAFHDAWSHFPEISSVSVRLSVITGRASLGIMEVRPSVVSLLSRSRDYVMLLRRGANDAFLAELDYDDLKGWMGHEFAHVLDYERLSLRGLASLGLQYLLSTGFREEFEQRANLEAVKHGLGLELLVSTQKSFVSPHLPSGYKSLVKRYYIPSWDAIQSYADRGNGFSKEDYDALFS